jgi:hypothetical protein
MVPDQSFLDGVRPDPREWYTARKGAESSQPRPPRSREQGLAIGDYPSLAWKLVKIFHQYGRITRAWEGP